MVGTPDVDELDGGIGGERIEVAHHQVDEADAEAIEGIEMIGLGPVGQNAAVDDRVEGLDPAAQHFRGTGQISHLEVWDTGVGQGGRSAAARHQLPPQFGQSAGQFDQTGLFVNGQQCSHGATSEGDPGPSPTGWAKPSTKRRMVSG